MLARRFLLPAALALAAVSPIAAQMLYLTTFWDVPESSTYYDAVENLADRGIVRGYDDASFRPQNRINRAEFTKIVIGSVAGKGELDGCLVNAKAAGKYPLFLDVKDGDWFFPFVCVAKMRGVVTGYGDGSFRPGAEINFVEAAKIVIKTLRPPTVHAPSPDAPDAIWYRPFVLALEEWDAIPMTIESLTHVMTRGEMAEILYRLQEMRGKPSRTYDDFTSFWTSYVNEFYGVEIPYPRVAPPPVFDSDGEPTGDSIAYPGRSLWRLSLGARIKCPPGSEGRCSEFEWIVDGFSRETAEEALDEIFTNPNRITVRDDIRSVGKRVIVYTERSGCTHREALVVGPVYAARLRWFCGGDNRDATSNYLFEYIAENIEFFGAAAASSVSSSVPSSASSSSSSGSSLSSLSSLSSPPSISSSTSSISFLSSTSSKSYRSAAFWWSSRLSSRAASSD